MRTIRAFSEAGCQRLKLGAAPRSSQKLCRATGEQFGQPLIVAVVEWPFLNAAELISH